MGLGKAIKKAVKSVGGAVSDAVHDVKKEAGKVTGDVLRLATAGATMGTSELLGYGKTVGQVGELGMNAVTGELSRQRKEAKANELAALNAQEAAAKKAADDDYYNRVMKARDAQVAAYMDSQTDLTSDDEALGNYGKTLGSFGETALGGKKKKMYY